MKNFKNVFKANGIVFECDDDTLISLVHGSTNGLPSNSKVQDGLTPWQEAKKDLVTATAVECYVKEEWDDTNSVEELKRRVATKHNVKISYNAVIGLVNA